MTCDHGESNPKQRTLTNVYTDLLYPTQTFKEVNPLFKFHQSVTERNEMVSLGDTDISLHIHILRGGGGGRYSPKVKTQK